MACLGQPASAPSGVPILDAAGLKGFGVYAWYGVFAPVATPQPVVTRLYRELKDAFAHPGCRPSWQNGALNPLGRI